MDSPDDRRFAYISPTEASSIAFWPMLAFCIVLVFVGYMAFSPRPPDVGVPGWLSDKAQHMLAFLALTVLAQAAFRATPRWRIAERLSFLGALIEVTQALPIVHRDCDLRDWIADTVMIVAVTAVCVATDRVRAGGSRGQPVGAGGRA